MTSFNICGINTNNERTLFRKVGDQFYTATDIVFYFSKHGAETKLRYKVAGEIYDTLYVQNGEVMEKAPLDVNYSLNTEVGNAHNDCTEVRCFALDDKSEQQNLVLKSWVAKGNVEYHEYVLPDGDYECRRLRHSWLMLDLNLKGEEVGFSEKNIAEFFNSYGVDGKQHQPKVDKFCPSKDKQEIGLTAIHNLFKTLKDNGLRLVYDDYENRLGIINDVDVKGCDSSDDDAVPHALVAPMFPNAQPLFVGECWSFTDKQA